MWPDFLMQGNRHRLVSSWNFSSTSLKSALPVIQTALHLKNHLFPVRLWDICTVGSVRGLWVVYLAGTLLNGWTPKHALVFIIPLTKSHVLPFLSLSLPLFQSILKCRVEAVMVSVDAECESVHMHIYIILREISFHLFVLHTVCSTALSKVRMFSKFLKKKGGTLISHCWSY